MSNWGGQSAVDSIIAEAMDAIALDHIAKLNTAHLSSALPSDLESRFRKLKSFPSSSSSSANPTPTPTPAPPTITTCRSLPTGKENSAPAVPPPPRPPAAVEVEVQDKMTFQMETPSLKIKSPHQPSLPNLHSERSGFSPSKRRDPPSPTDRQGCCFPFSPKKTTTSTNTTPKSKGKDRNGKERLDELDVDLERADEWGDMNKKMVVDIKEKQRKLKKALKEQEKVSKEAAKMVRWVKQASARMTHNINDYLFSDDDDELSGAGHLPKV